MTAFTCVYGVSFVAMGVLGLLPYKDGRLYAFEVFSYLYYWSSVQGWIFAI